MKNKKYLKSLQDKPCVFCYSLPCEAHHVKVKGVGGMGMKVPDYMCIPVCRGCHNLCHSCGGIMEGEQVDALFEFFVAELGETVGEGMAIKSLSKAMYEVIHGEI